MASDAELIAECLAGSEAGWHEVHRRYHRLVRSIASSYGLRGPDVDDIEQLTFMILQSSLARLRPGSRLAPWLSTVARRHTWRLLERRRRESLHDDVGDMAGPQLGNDVDTGVLRAAEDEALRAALVQLPARYRLLLEALYLRGDEPSYAEIAAEFGMPIGSIGPTRARCLQKLREILESADRPTDDQRLSPISKEQ